MVYVNTTYGKRNVTMEIYMFLNVISVGFNIIGKRKIQLNNSFIGKEDESLKTKNDKTQVEKRIAEIEKKVEYFPNEHFSDEVRFLLVQLKRKREESRKLRNELQILTQNFNDVVEERLKLIEALQWYADESIYWHQCDETCYGEYGGTCWDIHSDSGQRAYFTLKELGIEIK
jgi:hypothetical protein